MGPSLSVSAQSCASWPFAIISYKDVPTAKQFVRDYNPDIVILDEVHRLRHWQKSTGTIIKELPAPAVFAVGAPVLLERPEQLSYLVQHLNTNLLGPAWQFDEKYVQRNKHGMVIGFKDQPAVLKVVEPVTLARTLPPKKTHNVLLAVDPTTQQKKLMAMPAVGLLAKLKVAERRWTQVDRAEAVALISRLRKISNLAGTGMAPARSPKVAELNTILREISRERDQTKVVVTTRFRDTATVLAEHLTELGWPSLALATSSDLNDAKTRIESLHKAASLSVVVTCDDLSGKLPSIACDVLVHFDVAWSPTTMAARRSICATRPSLQIELILAESPEEPVRLALVKHAELLSEIISDPVTELEGLPSLDPSGLDRVVEACVDQAVLKALCPAQAVQQQITKTQPSDIKHHAAHRPIRKSGARAAIAADTGRRAVSSGGLGDVLVVASALREHLEEDNPSQKPALALAVTYSFKNDTFTGWKREYVNHLIRQVTSSALVVSWSPVAREFRVLSTYTGLNLTKIPTIGILDEVADKVGLKIPPELLATGTLERRRMFSDEAGVQFWKNGRLEELAQLVYEEARLIRDLFVVAITEGKLYYPAGPTGKTTPVDLDLMERLPAGLAANIHKRYRSSGTQTVP